MRAPLAQGFHGPAYRTSSSVGSCAPSHAARRKRSTQAWFRLASSQTACAGHGSRLARRPASWAGDTADSLSARALRNGLRQAGRAKICVATIAYWRLGDPAVEDRLRPERVVAAHRAAPAMSLTRAKPAA